MYVLKPKIPLCLAMEDVGLFCGHSDYFMVIWYILPPFGVLHQEKSGNPALHKPNEPYKG
jgi:hypothetical protein